MENTIYSLFRACRDLFFAFLCGIIPKLPDPIRYPLDMMGFTAYLERSINKSMDDRKKEQKEYMEYAKKIEKNRPVTPAKTAKIEFKEDAVDKQK